MTQFGCGLAALGLLRPLTTQSGLEKTEAAWAGWRQAGLFYGSMLHGFVVVFMLRVNTANEDSLLRLVKSHTQRHDRIVYAAERDPWLAANQESLVGIFDRRMVEWAELKKQPPGRADFARSFWLTAVPQKEIGTWIAQSRCADSGLESAGLSLLNWYRRHIAKRVPGERLENRQVYQLYRLP